MQLKGSKTEQSLKDGRTPEHPISLLRKAYCI